MTLEKLHPDARPDDAPTRPYPDESLDLTPETVGRLHAYVVGLCAGEVTPEGVAHAWPEFFDLARSFIAAHGSEELCNGCGQSHLLGALGGGAGARLSLAERRCLILLGREMRRHLMRLSRVRN